jgi:putative thioredoxin
MTVDTTDATFDQDVLARSEEVPVVVDLWAPWCGPCLTLGPVIESAVAATNGAVELVKVNIDENPRIATSFRVQSIPAVFVIHKRQVIDNFVGALPAEEVHAFINALVNTPSEADLLAGAGDEESLRKALELQPDHAGAVVALASLLVERHETDEALALLARIPETPETRRVAAAARLTAAGIANGMTNGEGTGHPPAASGPAQDNGSIEARLEALLDRVRDEDEARQELVDILETMDPDDPRRGKYRRALASRLY